MTSNFVMFRILNRKIRITRENMSILDNVDQLKSITAQKHKIMRCSRYCNGDRMHVILNGEPLEEVDCFKYLGLQVAADVGCERDVVHRMNEGYRAWGALKSVLSNNGLG